MYGSNKCDGSIVGVVTRANDLDFDEASESTRAEEMLVCNIIDDEGKVVKVSLGASIDPKSGNVCWCPRTMTETMQRTIGMSQMTSMLRDRKRNGIYETAIKKIIDHYVQKHDIRPTFLDIGTGTGLLSMFCARHGAKKVVACEMFGAMAKIAYNVCRRNGFEDTIRIFDSRSTEISMDDPDEMPDLLVSELLDSALLGESCLYSHFDAKRRLLKKCTEGSREFKSDGDCNTIPYSGEVMAAIAESSVVMNFVDCSRILSTSGGLSWRDTDHNFCGGGWPLIPVRWDEVAVRGGRTLSNSHKILDINFNQPTVRNLKSSQTDGYPANPAGSFAHESDHSLPNFEDQFLDNYFDTDIAVIEDGTMHGILLWWKVYLLSPEVDPARSHVYSTEPKSIDEMDDDWQDHWVQCVYPLPQPINCNRGDIIRVTATHDAVHIWLRAVKIFPSAKANSANTGSGAGTGAGAGASASADASDVREDAVSGGDSKRYRLSGSSDPAREIATLHTDAEQAMSLKAIEKVTDEAALESMREPPLCGCGWHVLNGAERTLMVNDPMRQQLWDRALGLLVREVRRRGAAANTDGEGEALAATPTEPGEAGAITAAQAAMASGARRVIIDTGDGSLLAIAASLKLRQRFPATSSAATAVSSDGGKHGREHGADRIDDPVGDLSPEAAVIGAAHFHSDCSDGICVVSVEKKQFSRIFYSQLASANELDEQLLVWDGGDWAEVEDFCSADDELNVDEDEEQDVDLVCSQDMEGGADCEEEEEGEDLEGRVLKDVTTESEASQMRHGGVDEGSLECGAEGGAEAPRSPATNSPPISLRGHSVACEGVEHGTMGGLVCDGGAELVSSGGGTMLSEDNGDGEDEVEGEGEQEERAGSSLLEAKEDHSASAATAEVVVAAVISECFYYQLSALPTWQALAFLYQRLALQPRMLPDAIVSPCRARVMVAPVELRHLHTCHGPVGTVSGFDHAAYDAELQGWHTHMYPYKLGQYRKRLLSDPVCAAQIDFRLGTADTSFIATGAVLTAGRCDCVAIWVDYCLWEPQIGLSDSSPGPCLKDEAVGGSRELSTSAGVTVTQDVIEWRAWDGQDFPYYYTLNLKFFEQPQPVEKGATFSSCATFKMGDSDFAFEFSFV